MSSAAHWHNGYPTAYLRSFAQALRTCAATPDSPDERRLLLRAAREADTLRRTVEAAQKASEEG